MIKTIRPVLLLLLLCLFLVPAVSQQRGQSASWWLTLEEGKRFFRTGAYGEALRSFEKAREDRNIHFTRLERDLITVLSINQVRRFGDDLGYLEIYIERENLTTAAAVLRELYHYIPRANFRNSSSNALSALGRLKNYPEAEFWIGEVYRAEGEFTIALTQYQRAYNNREQLENQQFESEILYAIAELRRIRREFSEMETILNNIVRADTLWSRESFARVNMLRSMENNGINRFLILFRHNNPAMEKAHRSLGFYFYESGRYDRAAEHLLFAFLIQNTVIIDALIHTRFDYSFSSLPALMNDISSRRDLLAYLDDTEYYKTHYYLANSLFGTGRRNSARELWTFLSRSSVGEWRGRSLSQLANPQLDPITRTIGRPGTP